MAFVLVIVVMLSLLAGATYYLSHRFYGGLVAFFPTVKFWPVLLVFSVLMLLVILGFAHSMLPLPKEVNHIIGIIGNYCMGIVLYLLVFTLITDLVFIIPRLLKLAFTTR